MSAIQAHQSGRDGSDPGRRRADLDHDLVAVVAMLAILALTAVCLLGQSMLPL